MGLTNIMLAIPSLIFALSIVALLGPGLLNVFVALGFTNWSYSCRITRSQVLSARSLEYVQAAQALGCGRVRLMFTQILPNVLGPILVIATLGVAGAILLEASLSFLGLGVQPPTPSWGSMLSQAKDQLFTAPWVSVFPGAAIFLTVLGLNLLGDGLRDVLGPPHQPAATLEMPTGAAAPGRRCRQPRDGARAYGRVQHSRGDPAGGRLAH